MALRARSSSSEWNCSLSVMYCASASVPDVQRCSSRSILARHGPRGGQILDALQPLGGQLRGRAFEHAADLDPVVDVLDGELGGHESAGRPGAEQSLLLEAVEHEPQRRARHFQPGRERNLAQPLARAEFAPEEEFAHLEERTKRLRFEPLGAWFH